MLNRHIGKAIIDVALFLEFSDEDLVDPDAAVQAMERLGFELQLMSESERLELASCFHDVAEEYGEKEAFVRELAINLGLT